MISCDGLSISWVWDASDGLKVLCQVSDWSTEKLHFRKGRHCVYSVSHYQVEEQHLIETFEDVESGSNFNSTDNSKCTQTNVPVHTY